MGDEAHVATLVMQFASEEEAADMAGVLHDDGLEPCPGSCAVDISEFEVDDIPDAQGVARIPTAEDLEATGAEGDPFSAYTVSFADGPFAYKVTIFASDLPTRSPRTGRGDREEPVRAGRRLASIPAVAAVFWLLAPR